MKCVKQLRRHLPVPLCSVARTKQYDYYISLIFLIVSGPSGA